MNNTTIKETKTTDELNAAKARDTKRLEALDTVLAVELALHREYLEDESLISHDELQEAVLAVLGLELPESENAVFDEINYLMCQWHWRWLTLDCGLDHYYAQPLKVFANTVSLGGEPVVLQADQGFPKDMSDVTDKLWEAEFADKLLQEKMSVDPCDETGRYSDQALLNTFAETHMINSVQESLR